MVHEIGVEGVVARHEDGQRVLGSPPGPADLLPEGRAGPGEPRHQYGVEAADVDAELESVGRGQSDELPGAQVRLQRPAFLREVATAVGGHPPRERRVDLGQEPGSGHGHLLGAAAGPDERQRPHVLGHQVGEQVGGLGRGGAADRCAVLAGPGGEGRLPQRQRHLAARRGVPGDRQDVQTSQPAGGGRRFGHRRRGEDERGIGAVEGADAAQPAEHVGDVGAEHAAVVVALVDDDVAQRPEERRPPAMDGQQGPVEHVRIGQDVLRVVAGPFPLVARTVAVVGAQAHVEAQRGEPGQLVVGEGLGGREVEDGGAPFAARPARGPDGAQGRELVGEGLARGGAGGHHDVGAGMGGVGRGGLVSPGQHDPAPFVRRAHVAGHPGRPVRDDGRAWRQHLQVGEPVGAAGSGREPVDQPGHGRCRRVRRTHARSLANGTDIAQRRTVTVRLAFTRNHRSSTG